METNNDLDPSSDEAGTDHRSESLYMSAIMLVTFMLVATVAFGPPAFAIAKAG